MQCPSRAGIGRSPNVSVVDGRHQFGAVGGGGDVRPIEGGSAGFPALADRVGKISSGDHLIGILRDDPSSRSHSDGFIHISDTCRRRQRDRHRRHAIVADVPDIGLGLGVGRNRHPEERARHIGQPVTAAGKKHGGHAAGKIRVGIEHRHVRGQPRVRQRAGQTRGRNIYQSAGITRKRAGKNVHGIIRRHHAIECVRDSENLIAIEECHVQRQIRGADRADNVRSLQRRGQKNRVRRAGRVDGADGIRCRSDLLQRRKRGVGVRVAESADGDLQPAVAAVKNRRAEIQRHGEQPVRDANRRVGQRPGHDVAVRVKNPEPEIVRPGRGAIASDQLSLISERRCLRPRGQRQEQKRRHRVKIELHMHEFIITAYFNKLQ